MSDFIKNLKSLFVEDNSKSPSDEKSDESKTEPTEKIEQAPTDLPTVETSILSETGGGKVSEKFTRILLKAIEKNNQEGFDYLEYKNSVRSLSKMNMDEATKYQSAFAMGQTMGANAERLIESAKSYQRVLADEKKKFDLAAAQQVQQKIDRKKEELADWEKQIAARERKIKELRDEIDKWRGKIKSVNSTLAAEEEKVHATQSSFVATYNNLFNQISKDIEKMSKYLKS